MMKAIAILSFFVVSASFAEVTIYSKVAAEECILSEKELTKIVSFKGLSVASTQKVKTKGLEEQALAAASASSGVVYGDAIMEVRLNGRAVPISYKDSEAAQYLIMLMSKVC